MNRGISNSALTIERAREALQYDPLSGLFMWRISPRSRTRVGDTAGCLTSKGYWTIMLDGKSYRAHRLAWFIVNGRWPINEIDHINGDRLDNRLVNLRDVPGLLNIQNKRMPRKNNKASLLGVSPSGSRWIAQIQSMGEKIYLGTFLSAHEASDAYLKAKRELHAGCTI